MDQSLTEAFTTGVHNLLNDEIIPQDAVSDEKNWRTIDGKMELMRGRATFGTGGGAGKVEDLHKGFKADGTSVYFRKTTTKIQTYNTTTEVWDDVITGLTLGEGVSFANYQSLAGTFVYVFSREGLWKISTSSPTDYADMYESTKNFKGYAIIDTARTFLWGRTDDPTGLYGSYVDAQDSTVYTTVSTEALANVATGTLAFKSGGARRTCFGLVLTVTTSGQVFTDDYNGVLVGDAGGTGTINYMTGEFTTDDTGAGTVDYQWEDSNSGGVTDFSKSATRLAGEGFLLRQDFNGDPILTVLPLEGSYYSIKETSAYKLTLDLDDVNPTNVVYRTDIGVPSRKAAIGTGSGIVFINTANPDKPVLTILERNPVGDNIIARDLTTHFDYTPYNYDTAAITTHNRYIMLACREESDVNDRILVIDATVNTVDISTYGAVSFMKDDGILYTGDPSSESVYKTFNGFDDNGSVLENYVTGKGERMSTNALKKLKKIRLRGEISKDQVLQVYSAQDDDDFSLVGTIRGDGAYVDVSSEGYIGSSMVGDEEVGGAAGIVAYPYFIEIKLKTAKFRKIQFKFVATEVGYVSLNYQNLFDYWTYEERLPKKYRLKQNVSIDGTTTDNDNPDF